VELRGGADKKVYSGVVASLKRHTAEILMIVFCIGLALSFFKVSVSRKKKRDFESGIFWRLCICCDFEVGSTFCSNLGSDFFFDDRSL
jgi:hypothetical protein